MARSELDVVAHIPTGTVSANTTVYVYARGTTTPVTVYAAETGSTEITQPLLTDAKGGLTGWVAPAALDLYPPVDGVTEPYEAIAAGYVTTQLHAAPADADIATGEMVLWLDQSVGATKLMIKAKDSAGTVRTAAVALS